MREPRGAMQKRKAELAPAEGSKGKRSRKEPGKNTAAAECKKLSEIKASSEDAGVVIPK